MQNVMSRTPVIGVLVEDLLFRTKIETTARQLGIALANAPWTDAALIILDLHNKGIDPIAWLEEFKQDLQTKRIPVLAFFSHVQSDFKKKAVDAGCNLVVPRSVLLAQLPQLLIRYVKTRLPIAP